MEVTVYSTTTCPYCKQLKAYLTKNGIAYKEKVIDQDDSARDEMTKVSGGFMGVPFTVITKDGKTETVLGFDKAKINKTLGIS